MVPSKSFERFQLKLVIPVILTDSFGLCNTA